MYFERCSRIDALVEVSSALLAPIGGQNSLWQDCGRNKWKVLVTDGNGCQRMQKPLILLVAATRFKINS